MENIKLKRMVESMRFWLHNMPLEWTMENEADDDDAEDGLCLDEDDVYEAESLTHLHSMHQELLEVDLPNPMEDDLPVDNREQQGLPTVHDLPPANIDDIAHNTESTNISKNSRGSSSTFDMKQELVDPVIVKTETMEFGGSSSDIYPPHQYVGNTDERERSEKPAKLAELQCDQCDFRCRKTCDMKRHKERKHEGIRYPCDQCSHVATELRHLKRHKLSIHEGVRYACNQCNYTATQPSHLRNHKKKKHFV